MKRAKKPDPMWLFLEFKASRVLFAPGPLGQRAVKVGPAGLEESLPNARSHEGPIEIGNHHVVTRLRSLHQNSAVWVDNHGVAGADFVIVNTHAVTENQKDTVVVSAGWKPSHQPTPAFWAAEFVLNRLGILRPLLPQPPVDDSH